MDPKDYRHLHLGIDPVGKPRRVPGVSLGFRSMSTTQCIVIYSVPSKLNRLSQIPTVVVLDQSKITKMATII